ncbi:DUF2076 family protein [Telluria beijingensis]|uniref:DUF2076 family protein n=1 Tax=Telluria beijingensis TaxID=3068633 RepID=UPI0027961595|nr:DUF2076 family protein [Massilia sp. REN29]
MNPSDEKMLQDFLGQLVQAKGVTKDPEADALIQRAVAQQPDAAYLLVQRALLVEQALGNAKARIAELESRGNKESGGGFLDANAWGNSAAQNRPTNPVPGIGQGGYQQAAPATAQAAQPARGGGFLGGAGGSMLGTVAATAAGVAAGSFLFHGIGNLLGNDGQGASNHLLADNAADGGAAEAAGGGALADQAGIGSVDEAGGGGQDSLADNGNEDSLGGFFDGDGSDEGLFG